MGELFPPAVKTQIREGGKSENIANEENKFWEIFLWLWKKLLETFVKNMFITT